MLYFIGKEQVLNLLRKLTETWDVYAPIAKRGGDVLFERIENSNDPKLNSIDSIDTKSRCLIPPKEIFFPQSEVMFSWNNMVNSNPVLKQGGDGRDNESKPRLVFGIRPCDYYALQITDRFFGRDPKDFYYVSKSNEALYVVFSCLTPPEPGACFCTSTGTGPYLDSKRISFDVQFTDLKDGFIVEAPSSRGEGFVRENMEFFEKRNEKELANELVRLFEMATRNVRLKVDFEGAINVVKEESEKPLEKNRLIPLYKEIANRCIYCGACLYACPTCTCFNVYDTSNVFLGIEMENSSFLRNSGGEGERIRVWDACVFSGYTREASGHNPRDKAYTRTARRYEHKLKYDFELHDRSGCVGCGRCLSVCPVDIGMSTFIEGLNSFERVGK